MSTRHSQPLTSTANESSGSGFYRAWSVADMPSQAGRRFFITGGNSGVGYAAAVELARKGAVVVLACRDVARGEEALRRLRAEAGSDSAAEEAEVALLDLASLESIRRAAEAEVSRGLPLHGLINNAGVMAPRRRLETRDGFELQFGTNVLGHYALTCHLIPALEMGRSAVASEGPRVVTVSSIAHLRGRIDFADLQSERSYVPMRAYAQSKLGNLMFAFELEHRLRSRMLGATSVAVHPGVARTRLFKVGSGLGLAGVAERALQSAIGMALNTTAGGAVPTLYGATASGVLGGGYYGPQGFREMRGGDVGVARVAAQAEDRAAQRRLWQICEELTGCRV